MNEYNSDYRSQVCGACGSILEVVYKQTPSFPKKPITSFWDFAPAFPDGKYRHYEVGLTKTFRDGNDDRLFYKLEITNPTRSFKDRGSVIEVAKAKEYGFNEVVCASTGNMAYSVAYYSKLYGLKAKIFVSKDANKDKVEEIRSTHDADITKEKYDFTKAQEMAIRYSKEHNAFLTGDYCYRKEGQKSVAYEIALSMHDVSNIIVPVGNATLLSATLKAIDELGRALRAWKKPRIIGVQAAKCDPFVLSFTSGKGIKYVKPRTAADAIAVGYPTFGNDALRKLRENGGIAISVSEAAMRAAQKSMLKKYGLTIELASAATIAAYSSLKGSLRGKSVLVISGGNV